MMSGRHVPVRMANTIAGLDFQEMTTRGISCLLLDIEGTIAPWNSQEVVSEVVKTLSRARVEGIDHIGLVSNMPKTRESMAATVAKKVHADGYWVAQEHHERKPGTVMLDYAMKQFHVEPRQVALIGDKFFDIVAGKRARVAETIWVKRLGNSDHPGDKWLYRPIEPLLRLLVKLFAS